MRQRIRGNETLTRIKRIDDKTSQNKKIFIEGPNQRREITKYICHPLTREGLIKNQNKNNSKVRDTKKLEKGSTINETKFTKVKANVLLINSIHKNKLLDNYINSVYKQ